ncbi:Vms1/Ankzf1 family peptidyl-tRNA hydrolase [Nocardioides sp. NPDC047086]|uniref:baeRF2 domain-containing protein n=1 Tax=Nocardioides sp. NPDC047086 TaxID=3154810 RepID=UPI0033F96370
MDTAGFTNLLTRPGPYATVLADVSQDSENAAHAKELRVRAACEELSAQGAPPDVVAQVSDRLDVNVRQPAPVARVVVATPDGVAYDQVAVAEVPNPVATWDALPDLGSWIAAREASMPFVLVLADHTGGDISLWDSGLPNPTSRTTVAGDELEHVHKVQDNVGWAAFRMQQTTGNVWRHNADKVAGEVTRLVRDHGHELVLVGGDPTTVGRLRDDLAGLSTEVVELASGQRAEDGGDQARDDAIRSALLDQVVRRRTALVGRLEEAWGRGERAATGVRDVADAFVTGRVETLLVDPGALAGHTLDPADHPGLTFGEAPVSGPVEAGEALIAAAVLTDAEVCVLPASVLGDAPVAALLRWA